MTFKTKAQKRYVVWRERGNGRWYPAETLPRDEAMHLAERLERNGEVVKLAPVPEFDPNED
jgi:hypothetical protein